MSAGRVCETHQEWCPSGECRWCEPGALAGGDQLPDPERRMAYSGISRESLPFWRADLRRSVPVITADIEDAMNRMWGKLVEREQPPRLPFDEWLDFYGKKDGG